MSRVTVAATVIEEFKGSYLLMVESETTGNKLDFEVAKEIFTWLGLNIKQLLPLSLASFSLVLRPEC